MLRALGAEAVEVRLPEHLEGLNGIILPGGESTTIGKLLVHYSLLEPLARGCSRPPGVRHVRRHDPAGARPRRRQQPVLGVMDIAVRRNAFGSQRDSFEQDLR